MAKTKKAKKKISKAKNKKRVAKKQVKPKQQTKRKGVMAIIPYSEIARPEVYKGKYTLIPTPFTETQIRNIIAPTPANIIKQRPGKGGGKWDYVPGWWFKKKLNFVFGFAHDFDILGERVDGDYITVKGKLTVKHPKTGQMLTSKADYGGAAIKYHKDKPHKPENYLDISNDFKAAATDCLKRCAVQLGFAMDVYGKNESADEGFQVIENGNSSKERKQAEIIETISKEEADKILITAIDAGFKSKAQTIAGVNRLLKTNIKELTKLTKSQAKTIEVALLQKKNKGK